MPRRASPRNDNLRRALAQEAARIMVQQGVRDFLLAKRKAAERLGVADAAALPRNAEVEAALMEYQRLFNADGHGESLTAQRRAATQAMGLLHEFAPRLVGAVLSGTATAHAAVQLHVFADRPEDVVLKLLDRGIAYDAAEWRHRMDAGQVRSYPGLRFEFGDQEFEATIFPRDGIRQAPVSPVDGRPMRRADTEEVKALLEPSASQP